MTMLEIAKALREMNLKDPNAWADELILKADNGPRYAEITDLSAKFLTGGVDPKDYIERVATLLMDTSYDPEGIEPIIAFASALVKAEPQEEEEEEEETEEEEAEEEEEAA
jgi:hypothetical protein